MRPRLKPPVVSARILPSAAVTASHSPGLGWLNSLESMVPTGLPMTIN